jgi:TnpA family transposase
VPVRSVHARANPKYFGRGKGVTYINYTSAGSIGFFGFVVPGTLRDSMVILDGLLEQHTSLRPTTLVTDSASYIRLYGRSRPSAARNCCAVYG